MVVDLALIALAWLITLYSWWFWLSYGYGKDDIILAYFFGGSLFIPLINAIWLQFRFNQWVSDLSALAKRKELASLSIPANKHIASELKWPLIRALAPTVTTWPFFAALFFVISSRPDHEILQMDAIALTCALIGMFSTISTIMIISLGGLLNSLTHQCRSAGKGLIYRIAAPFVWSIVSLGAGMVTFIIYSTVVDMLTENEKYLTLMISISILAFPGMGLAYAIYTWQKAVKGYYCFDEKKDPPPLPD